MKTFSFSKMNNGDLGSCGTMAIEVIEKSGNEEAISSAEHAEVQQANTPFQAAIGRNIYSDKNDELAHADDVRDEAYVGIRRNLTGLTYSPVPEIKQAAKRLLARLDQFGESLESKSLTEQTTFMNSIVAELRKDEHAEDVATTTLTPWVDALDNAEKAFEVIFDLRGNDQVAIRETVSASAQRKQLIKSLTDLEIWIQSMAIATKNPSWNLIHSQLLNRFESAKHAGKKRNDSAGDNTPSNP